MSAADRLDQIEARANAATKGPWVTGGTDMAGEVYFGTYADPEDPTEPGVMLGVTGTAEDAALIAHARTDVPYLIGQVRWLLDELSAAVADNEKKDAALRAVLDFADGWQEHAEKVTNVYGKQVVSVEFARAEIVRAIEEALT